ncbi:hypothetical protein P154DRAFT_588535 [Amniculicola lignicola CBS 123094]|uniref:Uncharacterized protein n=1 Tax=Amniculicola lignicola CBS 123094 TaxID=1392246 RepID=A0A6A5WQH6_9PLEO|nr:hypothetical protein P154DRAFT_588535 [Amniculicola lignicola CBS 123094]
MATFYQVWQSVFSNEGLPPSEQIQLIRSAFDHYEKIARAGIQMTIEEEDRYIELGKGYHKIHCAVRSPPEGEFAGVSAAVRLAIKKAYEITSVAEYDDFFRPWKAFIDLCNQIIALSYKTSDLADMRLRGEQAHRKVQEVLDQMQTLPQTLDQIEDAVYEIADAGAAPWGRSWWITPTFCTAEWSSWKSWLSALPSTQRWVALGHPLDMIAHRELIEVPEFGGWAGADGGETNGDSSVDGDTSEYSGLWVPFLDADAMNRGLINEPDLYNHEGAMRMYMG